MSSDQNERPSAVEPQTESDAKSQDQVTSEPQKRVLIGSQRDPDAYRPKRDWTPVTDEETSQETSQEVVESETPPVEQVETTPKHFPPPNIRDELPPELEEEFEMALGDASLEDLMAGDDGITSQQQLEPETRCSAKVVAVRREDVFVELGGREQGTVPAKLFAEEPKIGDAIDVIVNRFNREDGIYELMIPNAAVSVSDWGDLREDMLVDAMVTGHNSGGLECEVNHIRGFIPASQISLYHVEDLAQFVGEKFMCLVTEANPQRRNLVLSRRAVLEREREEAKKQLLESLAPGQIHDGVVRKLLDFGAFVDLGGVDGLLHVSQLGWQRVNHPSDVLTEGQSIKVKIEKIDPETGKISLGYRDMIDNPWTDVEAKFPPRSVVRGKVTKLMEFGAFVELESGIEGLVHISELTHRRVSRVSEIVNEADEVEVVVLSVDVKAQRISLSMKDAHPLPESDDEKATPAVDAAPAPKEARNKSSKPLKGGTGGAAGGERFGLNW